MLKLQKRTWVTEEKLASAGHDIPWRRNRKRRTKDAWFAYIETDVWRICGTNVG